ncbi:MAG: SMP-30/gluconolactonase/LRE family protein [Verrucomicrobia bacterium]|nr:SMP-30/gluconolactonase/LRE family protein [Verrucomicrobiota bacterium]
MTKPLISILLFAFILKAGVSLNAQDTPLSDVLIDGENWELVAEGYQFTDAACADAYGSFYFADVAKGTSINRISPDGEVSVHIDGTPRISGLKFGPDGRLFACTQNPKKQIVAFDKAGKMTVLVEVAQPNDLVVRYDGRIYFTETGKQQVTLIDRDGSVRAVDAGIKAPNGISLSADQETLAVSDYGGTNVWTFRIESNGSLSGKEPYMMLRPPNSNQAVAKGDGMTTDQAGRYYVTSDLGIQMFDPTGRMGGIISKPQNKGTVSVAFAGRNLDYLYAASSDKIYRRKTKAKGVLFFQRP